MPRRRQNSESTNPVEERTPQVQSDTTPEENTVESGGSEERVQEEAADGVGTEEPAGGLPQNRRWRKRLPRRQPGRRLRHRYQKRNLLGRFRRKKS